MMMLKAYHLNQRYCSACCMKSPINKISLTVFQNIEKFGFRPFLYYLRILDVDSKGYLQLVFDGLEWPRENFHHHFNCGSIEDKRLVGEIEIRRFFDFEKRNDQTYAVSKEREREFEIMDTGRIFESDRKTERFYAIHHT